MGGLKGVLRDCPGSVESPFSSSQGDEQLPPVPMASTTDLNDPMSEVSATRLTVSRKTRGQLGDQLAHGSGMLDEVLGPPIAVRQRGVAGVDPHVVVEGREQFMQMHGTICRLFA